MRAYSWDPQNCAIVEVHQANWWLICWSLVCSFYYYYSDWPERRAQEVPLSLHLAWSLVPNLQVKAWMAFYPEAWHVGTWKSQQPCQHCGQLATRAKSAFQMWSPVCMWANEGWRTFWQNRCLDLHTEAPYSNTNKHVVPACTRRISCIDGARANALVGNLVMCFCLLVMVCMRCFEQISQGTLERVRPQMCECVCVCVCAVCSRQS